MQMAWWQCLIGISGIPVLKALRHAGQFLHTMQGTSIAGTAGQDSPCHFCLARVVYKEVFKSKGQKPTCSTFGVHRGNHAQ